jgi:hypothetical protein
MTGLTGLTSTTAKQAKMTKARQAHEQPRQSLPFEPHTAILALQRMAGNQAVSQHVQGVLRGGHPVEGATRAEMEGYFGHDFSDVGTHTTADQSSQALTVTPAPSGLLVQRKCACGGHSGAGGSCSRCRANRLSDEDGRLVQPKLNVSHPGDRYEQEADHIADQVMRKPDPAIRRQTSPEAAKEEEMPQIEVRSAHIYRGGN